MRTFKRLEIECISSDAFGLGSNTRTTMRQLAHDSFDVKEGGIAFTESLFRWLKANYFGYGALRKLMVNDLIETMEDRNLAELLKRVLPDEGTTVGANSQGSSKR